MLELAKRPGEAKLIGFGEMVVDGIEDYGDDLSIRLANRLADRLGEIGSAGLCQLSFVEQQRRRPRP